MSLKTDALTIKNETVAGANTATRIGGLFENIATVTETVDTIADLRAFDTSNLVEGDQIYVKAHNTTGLNKGFGKGLFKWITTEVLTIDQTIGSGGDTGEFATLPLNEAVAGDGRPFSTDEFYGDNLIFTNGVKATGTSNQVSDPSQSIRSSGKGETSVRMNIEDAVPSGTKAYFDDDDGVYIRPTFTGFDGHGYWKRILTDENYVTPQMYGAIAEKSLRNVSPFDSAPAIQKCFDSLFNVVVPAGYYYIGSTVYHRRYKQVRHIGAGAKFNINPATHGRYYKYSETDLVGVFYSDLDIDILELRAGGLYTGYIDCRLITPHTKRAVRANGRDRIKGEWNFTVLGNPDSMRTAAENGTRAFEIDFGGIDGTRDTFSNGGSFSGNDVYLGCSGCYSGITGTPAPEGVNTFGNTNNFNFGMRDVKKPVDLRYGGSTQSNIDGSYQSMNGTLDATQSEVPVIYIDQIDGGYIDCVLWDPTGPGRHDFVLEIGAGDGRSIIAGPKLLKQPTWGYIKNDTYQYLSLESRISGEVPTTIEQLRGMLKVLKVNVSSADILNSNTTPINLKSGGPDVGGIVIHRAHIKNITGTTNYSTNTTLTLQANPDASRYRHDAGTIDIGSISPDDKENIATTPRQGNVGNSSSADSVIQLIAKGTENPTGGDKAFQIIVYYEEL